MAHAVAAECNFAGRKTALLTVSGRTLMAMRGTEGAMEIEELFREAKRLQPSIIFIDELECFSSVSGCACDTMPGVFLLLGDLSSQPRMVLEHAEAEL